MKTKECFKSNEIAHIWANQSAPRGRAFRFAIECRERGWKRSEEAYTTGPFTVGPYQLDAVNEQGVVAGCHRIAWDEIERFAKLEGWV